MDIYCRAVQVNYIGLWKFNLTRPVEKSVRGNQKLGSLTRIPMQHRSRPKMGVISGSGRDTMYIDHSFFCLGVGENSPK